MKYFLQPNDSHKSFYNKCYVEELPNGDSVLYSYDTKILTKKANGDLVRHWLGWSQTTGRHINAFCGLNKKQFEALPTA